MKLLFPADLRVGDVVCFAQGGGRFPFGDHEVVREDEQGFFLRRPYIDSDSKEAAYEEGYWFKNSNFQFHLLERAEAA